MSQGSIQRVLEMSSKRTSRRNLLRFSLVGLAGVPVVSTLLAACGGDDDDEPQPTATVAAGPTATAAAPQPTATTGGGAATAETVAPQGTLTYGAGTPPDTMDPQKTGTAASNRILVQVFTPLVWNFPGDDTFYAGLATQWEASEDGLRYSFTLRPDVVFHNGEPFNAEAVAWTFDRMADPANGTLATLPSYERCEVHDDLSVTIVLSQPVGPFIGELSEVGYMPIPPLQSRERPDEFAVTPAGTGPFSLVEFVPNSHATLAHAPDYAWGPSDYFGRDGAARLERIEWRIILEPATRVLALQSGEIDMAEDVAPVLVAQIEADDAFQMIYHDTVGSPKTIQMNCERSPTSDIAVRRAIAQAIDKQSITDTILLGTREPSHGPLEPATMCYDDSFEGLYPFDPDVAREQLDAAGWLVNSSTGIREKDGEVLSLDFVVIANDGNDEAAQVIQANLQEIGMDVQITVEAFPGVASTYNAGGHHFANEFWVGSDPSFLASMYHSSAIESGFNWSHYRNTEVDTLLDQGLVETDYDERCHIYHEIQQQIMEDCPMVPLYGLREAIGAKRDIAGLHWARSVFPLFYDVTKDA